VTPHRAAKGGIGADRDERKFIVARAADIPPGSRLIVELGRKSVGIFNVDGEFYAIVNRCPHRGAALCMGDVIQLVQSPRPGDFRLDSSMNLLVCPWHGWEYDLKTGESWLDPRKAKALEVRIEAGSSLVGDLADGAANVSEHEAPLIQPTHSRIKGPYTAEIMPVEVEDDYVVVIDARIASEGKVA
jgi:3-phenylpropionate/trans-cinnamate dioxygenase ferredoxin subunit